MSFSFGSTPKTATGFTLPTATPATTAATAPGFQFSVGSGAGDNKLSSNLFGTPTNSATSLSFGLNQAKTAAPNFSFASPTTQTSIPATLNLGSTSVSAPASTGATLQLGFSSSLATPASTPASTGTVSFTPIIGSCASAASTGGLSLGSIATSTVAPKIATATSTAATSVPALSLGVTPSSSLAPSTSAPTAASTIPPTGALTFSQLEDSINKWTIDLEEQGKFFVNQAKQLNAWDSLLISNGEKILNLNSSIERVKQQQSQLDQELDFILSQQKELEELISPLEKELADIPVTDIDRNQMYQFAEIIDSQLKQMSDDLKEVIENINESHKDEEVTNPITQIGKILNAHMNSLQWIDRNTAQISAQLEEISKIEDANRRNLNFNSPLSM